jgi:hypothetical protein
MKKRPDRPDIGCDSSRATSAFGARLVEVLPHLAKGHDEGVAFGPGQRLRARDRDRAP